MADYDFIVIGSGFGGSVSAYRLSQKGYKVAVLEKGKRYRTEDFPKTNWNLRKSTWMPKLGLFGIQALTLLKHALVLHGVGVGGGSLVYANQLLVPPDEAFKNPGWGSGDWKEKLAPHYAEAQRMLGVTPCPSVGRADKALREVGKELVGEDTFTVNNVGVFFGEAGVTVPDPYFDGDGPERTGCTFCSACMIGCPVGAKNTLDKNYLYFAEKQGVDIVPETEVLGVRELENGEYEILTKKGLGLFRPKKNYTAKGVVFSGGVMGTVPLLMKCKQQGLLPKLSERVGQFVRTNSEAILAVISRDKSVNWNDHLAITSGIHATDTTYIEMVRYNKGSDVIYNLATLLTDGGDGLPRWLKFIGTVLRNPLKFLWTLWPFGWSERGTGILVMQTDESFIHLDYKRRILSLGRFSVNSKLPEGHMRAPAYIPVANEVARRVAKKMDGEPMSGWAEILLDAPTTAHILGGSAMGETPDKGVVDLTGKVFGYDNLYVADGSVVPANLGVNPSLTITALSEYIMSNIPAKENS